jgi:hypothetical protein
MGRHPQETTMTARYRLFDPLLPEAEARALLRLCERFGAYGTYGAEPIRDGLGRGLTQRHDAAMSFVKRGGRFGRREAVRTLAARTNYFRETYAYAEPVVDGIEPFLHHEGFVEAARAIYDRPIVRPSIVYANLLVPGQELSVHTDVPEFRGANRTKDPEWLLVAMHHSGLFERWRMPIATGVSWWGEARGGDFAFYPDGADAPARTLAARHDTAVLLDTDSVFHGVDRVAETSADVAALRPGMKLAFAGDGRWQVRDGARVVAEYAWEDLRFSISWKAYCFADEAERRAVDEHRDDLAREQILATLLADLRERGRLGEARPPDAELALLLIDEYIHFPKPQPAR